MSYANLFTVENNNVIIVSRIVQGFTNASASESVNIRGLKRQIRDPLIRQMHKRPPHLNSASPTKSTRRGRQ